MSYRAPNANAAHPTPAIAEVPRPSERTRTGTRSRTLPATLEYAAHVGVPVAPRDRGGDHAAAKRGKSRDAGAAARSSVARRAPTVRRDGGSSRGGLRRPLASTRSSTAGCPAGLAGWRVRERRGSCAPCAERRARWCGRRLPGGYETRPRHRRTRTSGSCTVVIRDTGAVERIPWPGLGRSHDGPAPWHQRRRRERPAPAALTGVECRAGARPIPAAVNVAQRSDTFSRKSVPATKAPTRIARPLTDQTQGGDPLLPNASRGASPARRRFAIAACAPPEVTRLDTAPTEGGRPPTPTQSSTSLVSS